MQLSADSRYLQSGPLKLMESTIKHPFKATSLPLKELYSNSRKRHQIDKPENNRSKHLKKVLITQQIQKKARMDKKGLALRVCVNLLAY